MRWRKLAPLCLERSGAVPLVVDITVSDGKGDGAFLNALLPHVSRIGSLRLTGCSAIETVAGDLPGFFTSPMLGLTSIELEQTAEPAQLFPSDDSPVPPPFLNVSNLRSLSLTRTPLYSTLFVVPFLVELKLTRYRSRFDFGTFLAFLESNPNLERVTLDIRFVAGSVETRNVSLPHLRHLSIACSSATDSRGILSSIPLPRGVRVEVISTHPDRTAQLHSFLPSPPTSIRELLNPITTIKTQITPREIHLFGNGSSFTFRSSKAVIEAHAELMLFPSPAVREFHTDIHPFEYTDTRLSWMMESLPALETLAFSKTEFPPWLPSALTEEPVLCPALKTIAFFDCGIDSDILKELGEAIVKRKDLMAVRLYRVVIVNSTGMPPDLASIRELRKCVPCVEVRVDDKLPNLS